jgi:hypothetical protein
MNLFPGIMRALLISILASYEVESVGLLLFLIPAILIMSISDTTEKWYYKLFLQRY